MARGLYTMSELVELILQDIGVWDLPIIETVGKDNIIRRIEQSALKEFSTRCPYMYYYDLTDQDLAAKPGTVDYDSLHGVTYVIPESVYAGHTILGIATIKTKGVNTFNNFYEPAAFTFAPDMMIDALSDIQLAATLGHNMARSLTWEWIKPNKIKLYNGWVSGKYVVKLMLDHDSSLSTLSDTAMTHFRKLATYDVEMFLYNRFKRIQNLDTGVGNFELRIDDWQDAESKFRDYLDQIDEDQSIDLDDIEMF